MERDKAVHFTYEELKKWNLKDWSVRLTTNINANFLGMCSYRDKCIILNTFHLELHPDVEIFNTIRHEIAHALCPGERHNEVWADKAREVGCDNTLPCSHLSFSPEIVDAIRSGATVEITYDEQVIRTPKYKVTRLQEKCEYCGKVAVTVSEKRIEIANPDKPDLMFITLECGHTIVKSLPKGTPFHNFQAFGDPNCEHEWDKNTCVKCDRKRPFPFQLEGMRFAEQALAINKGVAFLDEMGLGKTIQMGGVIMYHPEIWPVLYVVKSALKFQTFKFCLDWMGHICQIINTSSDDLIPGFKGYIISYDMMVPKTKKMKKTGKIVQMGFDIKKILDSPIKTIVLDECQQIKNPDSGRTKAVRALAKNRTVIALSGTPWKNRGGELYSMFNMIAPFKFPYHQRFLDVWVEHYWHGKYLKQGGIRNPLKFKEFIKDIAIRRERKEVMPELPATLRTKLQVKFTLDEETQYDEAVEGFARWYEEAVQTNSANGINILAKIQRLRHITGAAKVPATMAHLDEFLENNDKKIVIFVHHKDVGDAITYQCREKYELGKKTDDDDDDNGNGNSGPKEKIPVLQLTSDLSPKERFEMTELFNKTKKVIMVASTLASGEGLNLQTCADCIMHERQWNPANEEQAEGRFCRIGQSAPEISAVYAQVMGSIDDYLDQIVEKKRRWFHAAMNTGETPKWNQDEIMKELADVIVTKHRQKKPRTGGDTDKAA